MQKRIGFALSFGVCLSLASSGLVHGNPAETTEEINLSPIHVMLRTEARDLSQADVKTLLQDNGFYASCWNYNGDFCNPDGSFENDLLDNQDGTVTDRATGLMWQKGGAQQLMTWIEAKAYAQRVSQEGFAGHSDWRMPTLEELVSLLENEWKSSHLFIDPVFDQSLKYCWSLDTKGTARAWKTNFHLGFPADFPMSSKNSVRLVRTLPSVVPLETIEAPAPAPEVEPSAEPIPEPPAVQAPMVAEEPVEAPGGAIQTEEAGQEMAQEPSAPAEEQVETTFGSSIVEDDIFVVVEGWRLAWEESAGMEGDIESYISYYSNEFRARGLDREGWKKDKARKNGRKKWIKVELSDVDITEVDQGERFEVRFKQDYQSSNFSVSSKKMLILKREESGWKIIREKSI